MAWTTSAGLRARPVAWGMATTQLKTAKYLYASLRRATARWHPSFALALPLATLGLLSPLIPPGLTAGLLLAAGAALCIVAIPSPHTSSQLAPSQARKREARASLPASLLPDNMASPPNAPQRGRLAAKLPRPAPGQRERSWTELMARVNHDLRTPLNAVVGFSELMALELFGPLGDERYQDYVHHIRDSAADLLKSTEDTLALTALMASPSRRGRITACDLELLTREAWGFLSRKAAGRAVVLDPIIPTDLEVMGESRTLRQILVNMLSEGVARAANGERVILTAACDGELVELAVSVSKERARSTRKGGALPICLARTLLEMQGTTLLEVEANGHGWRAVTVLDRAAQADFFLDCRRQPAEQSAAVYIT